MNNKLIAIILLAAGALLLLLSVTADMTGLGAAPNVFGWKQIVGSVLGIVAAAAGGALLRK